MVYMYRIRKTNFNIAGDLLYVHTHTRSRSERCYYDVAHVQLVMDIDLGILIKRVP